jgi:hypothetical protein
MDLERAGRLLQQLEETYSEDAFVQLLKELDEALRYDFRCPTCGCTSYRNRKPEFRPSAVTVFEDLCQIVQCKQCKAVNISAIEGSWFAYPFSKYSSIITEHFEDSP